jgi:hypothetical protein
MSLVLNEPTSVALHSNSNTTSGHAPRVESNYWYCMENDQCKIIRDQLLMKTPIESKDNSNSSKKETYHSSPDCHTLIQQVLPNHLHLSPLSVHCRWNQSSNLELSPH